MPSKKRQFGDIGEKEAETFLTKNGFKIIDRNYRVKNLGEIDLIGEKDNKLIFFEVKTRSAGNESVFPIESSINLKKRSNLKRICEIYLSERRVPSNKEWQIDAIFIKVKPSGEHMIDHFENILWEEYY